MKKYAGTINIAPTWKSCVQIYLMLLENGTPKGKEDAKAGLYEMAEKLDALNGAKS